MAGGNAGFISARCQRCQVSGLRLAADVDFLITGDRDFTEARKLGRTKIVSVSQFNELVCRSLD